MPRWPDGGLGEEKAVAAGSSPSERLGGAAVIPCSCGLCQSSGGDSTEVFPKVYALYWN